MIHSNTQNINSRAEDRSFKKESVNKPAEELTAKYKQALEKICELENRVFDISCSMNKKIDELSMLYKENSLLCEKIKKSFYGTLEALAETIEKKDSCTGGHTKRVVKYSESIAKNLGLSKDEIDKVRWCAVLHDIGKIGIADQILKKPASLAKREWELMYKHPEMGYEILRHVDGLEEIVEAMRHHHERWDGLGYPLGLVGKQIPFFSRIIAVADTYDAIVSFRPYREGASPQKAFNEIKSKRGSQFDAEVVDAFIISFNNGELNPRNILKNI